MCYWAYTSPWSILCGNLEGLINLSEMWCRLLNPVRGRKRPRYCTIERSIFCKRFPVWHMAGRLCRASSRTASSWRDGVKSPEAPTERKHGVDDEYRWMHDSSSRELLQHLERENQYSSEVLRPLQDRVGKLFRSMVERQPQADTSVPEQSGPFLYYTTYDGNKAWSDVGGVEWGPRTAERDGCYDLYYTVHDKLRRPWQVRRVSLQWQTRRDGDSDGESTANASSSHADPGPDPIPGWNVDGDSDRVVFSELGDAYFVDVGRTKDHSFVVLNVHSKTSSEVLLVPSDRTGSVVGNDEGADGEDDSVGGGRGEHKDMTRMGTEGLPVLLRQRQAGVEYYVDHSGDAFYIVTNSPHGEDQGEGMPEVGMGAASGVMAMPLEEIREYHLVRLNQAGKGPSLDGLREAPWEVVLKSGRGGGGACRDDDGTIDDMDLFRNHCVLYECSGSQGVQPRLRVVPLGNPGLAYCLPIPTPGAKQSGNLVDQHKRDDGGDDTNEDKSAGLDVESLSDENVGMGGRDCRGPGDHTSLNQADEPVIETGPRVARRGERRVDVGIGTLRPGVNDSLDSPTVRFSVSSPLAPEDVYDLHLVSGQLELLRRMDLPRFDTEGYRCYTIEAISLDGERVPLTIAHRVGLEMTGENPILMHGYGAYGMNLSLDYQPSHTCLLERGWVLAFAHTRGGGELGKAWHAAGRGMKKWSTFWDFEACAELLVSMGYTKPARMAIHASSAGGLVAGVMANTRPDLFAAMVMKAPFLSVLGAMQDSSLPLTVHEFEEWGDPRKGGRKVEEYLRSYSPYENVKPQAYPSMLITGSLNDNRVNFWDPAKWVARVRKANTGKSVIMLHMSSDYGHLGTATVEDSLEDTALELAFLEQELGVSHTAGFKLPFSSRLFNRMSSRHLK